MTTFTVPVAAAAAKAACSDVRPPTRPVAVVGAFVRDIYFGGLGRIGPYTVKVDGDPDDIPLRRRVRLYRDRDGIFVREVWSDAATGLYQFDWVDERAAYTVIAYDYEHDYRAVVADNLTPTVIG